MDHPCHKCGAQIEQGITFCPHCAAPQIRVASSDVSSPAPLPDAQPAVTSQNLSAGSEARVPAPSPVSAGQAPSTEALDWSQALTSGAAAGVVIAFAWLLPLTGFLIAMLAGGALTVGLYRRRRPGTALTRGNGARLGAIAGLIGYLCFSLVLAVEALATRSSGKLRAMILQALRDSVAGNPDPNAQQALEMMSSPQGLAVLITLVMVIFLGLFLIAGSLGGVFGAALFRDRDR